MGSRILDFPVANSHIASVLLDSSVLIYYLEGVKPYNLPSEEIFQNIVDENIRGFLSVTLLTVSYRPLKTDEYRSCNPATEDDNLIIHGDNLHALKALLPRPALCNR